MDDHLTGQMDKLRRREFLKVSGGIAALAFGGPRVFAAAAEAIAPSASNAQMPYRCTLDLGFRAPRSGPVTTLKNGELLWVTSGPEAPYLSPSMWRISRLAMRRSTNGGNSWGEAQILQRGTDEYSVMSFGLVCLSSGDLLHIFARSAGYDYETGSPERSLRELYFQHSSDNGRTFTEAKKLETGERYQGDVLSFEQLRDGRIVYPFCFLTNVRSQFAVSACFSDDGGHTWKRSKSVLRTGGGGFESGASEPTVVELPTGKLWMLIRSQTGFLWESFSDDRGETWHLATETILPSSNAPATAMRLSSGEIAVAWNDDVHSNYARQSLVLGLTRDGKNFRGLREIDFTDFTDDPATSIPHTTYAFLTETKDGDIAVSYNKGNWSRHNKPTMAVVGKEWLMQGDATADLRDGRTGWHTIDPGPKLSAAAERYILEDGKLWLEIEQHKRSKQTTGIVRNVPLVSDGEIRLTVKVPKGDAFLLFGNSLLSPRNADEGCLRIRFGADNNIYVAAGKPSRTQNNRRSTEYSYLSQVIGEETAYPRNFDPAEPLDVSVGYNAANRTAKISVNGDKPIELRTSEIFGLTFLGMLIANGGQIRFNSIRTILKQKR